MGMFWLFPVFSLWLFNSLFWFWEKNLDVEIEASAVFFLSPTLPPSLLIYFLFLHYCAQDSKPQSKWEIKEGGIHFPPPHSRTLTLTRTTHSVTLSFPG